MPQTSTELVFLGSGGAIQAPAFFCTCATCEAARQDPRLRRTRASIAVLGQETVVVDPSPDLEAQLDREQIRRVDRVFVTHWHWDHIAGLGALGEPSSCAKWPPVSLYLPLATAHHFDEELSYLAGVFDIHPVEPSDLIELPDATWRVVKTTHTDHSVGFIVEASRRLAYLVDGVVPPADTVARLQGADLLILEATLDELVLPEGEQWVNFSLDEAVDFWRQTGIDQCILTHLSCHSWRDGRLCPGLSHDERRVFEQRTPGLTFAHDGLRVQL